MRCFRHNYILYNIRRFISIYIYIYKCDLTTGAALNEYKYIVVNIHFVQNAGRAAVDGIYYSYSYFGADGARAFCDTLLRGVYNVPPRTTHRTETFSTGAVKGIYLY